MTADLTIQPLDPADEAGIALVAERMRATLVEVLGASRGAAMYTPEWLRGRVREHLGRDDAGVWLARRGEAVVGHTIVREEPPGAGLFSTTWVAPAARRRGIADALLDRGEAWMRERGITRSATHTAADNAPLHRLYERRGYRIVLRDGEMVRFERPL